MLGASPLNDRHSSPLPTGDDELVWAGRIRAGDSAAFDAMFTAYAASLYSYAHHLVRSRAEAQELVHDVFARIWEQRATWEVTGSVGAYLHGAVRHRAINHMRRRRYEDAWQERSTIALSDTGGRLAPNTDDSVLTRDLAVAFERALAALPERRREIYVLNRRYGLSYAEIARLLGLSPKTVENQMARALQSLHEMLAAYLP